MKHILKFKFRDPNQQWTTHEHLLQLKQHETGKRNERKCQKLCCNRSDLSLELLSNTFK